MHRWIEIGKLPLVCRYLTIRMLKLLKEQQPEVFFGELRIHQRQRGALESQVPCGEPGKLPFVRNRHDPHGIQVPPMHITNFLASFRWSNRIALEPAVYIKKVD